MDASDGLASLHGQARAIFTGAVEACDIAAGLDRRLRFEGGDLHRLHADGTCGSTLELGRFRNIIVVAIGKAAGPMLDALLERLRRRDGVSGIYCSNQPPRERYRGFQSFSGGHPVPNEESFAAARAAIELLTSADEHTLIFFLISGGGSAMFELPLDPGITLAETIAFYRVLLGSGAPIAEVNTLRKRFSAVKGGRLALAAPRAAQVNLLLPDVPLRVLDALASGPTCPDRSTPAEARALVDRYGLGPKLPEAVRRFFARAPAPAAFEEEVSGEAWFEVVLSSEDLVEHARSRARRAGFHVVVDHRCDDWDYNAAARYLLDRLQVLRAEHPRLCLLSVGEVTVKLSDDPGRGGRNQQFALACARELSRHRGERLAVLSAGSDGIDGNTPAAGAIADTGSVARADALGFNTAEALAAFDAYPLFTALGDLVVMNPTGLNLRDVRLLLSEA